MHTPAPSEILREAHDLMQDVNFVGGCDIVSSGASPIGAAASACDVFTLALLTNTEFDSNTLSELGEVVMADMEYVTGMCVEGAMLKASQGDLGSFALAKDFLAAELGDEPNAWFDTFTMHEINRLRAFSVGLLSHEDIHKRAHEEWRERTFDALLKSSKVAEEAGL